MVKNPDFSCASVVTLLTLFPRLLAEMLANGIIIIDIRVNLQFCINITVNNPIKVKESLNKSSAQEFNISENLSFTLREARENFEREYLSSQLKKFSGNISKTAKFVGMERSALHRKLKLLGIKEFN